LFRGLCFVVCALTEITSIEFVPINLTTISDLQISAFPKGEEFWLTMHELPKSFSQVILETTNVKEYFGASVALSERQTTYYSKPSRECNRDSDSSQSDEYLSCMRKNLWLKMRPSINCSIAGFEEFYGDETDLDECSDRESALHSSSSFDKISFSFLRSPETQNCLVPCFQMDYSFKLMHFRRNSIMSPENRHGLEAGVFLLMISFQTFLVEQRVETLVYDFGSFVAAAGGNLGLFLGLSFFSAFQMALLVCYKFTNRCFS
jgi:hypothetical protein